MGKTSIEWTNFSINPIRARHKITGAVGHYCEKISQGCANCYASNLQKRFQMPAFNEQRGDDNIEVFLDESKLQEVLRRKKPTRFFWCDMTDIFGAWVTDEMLDKCFAVMALTPQHTHQILTKRPERMLDYLNGNPEKRQDAIGDAAYTLTGELFSGAPDCGEGFMYLEWPLPNVWLGTSVENQEQADKRIPHLLRVPAAVRFLSVEPMLGAIDLSRCLPIKPCHFADCACIGCLNRRAAVGYPETTPYIDWIICGFESGHNKRPFNLDHARSLRDQCQAAGVPFFFKQVDKVKAIPDDLMIREFPNVSAGAPIGEEGR